MDDSGGVNADVHHNPEPQEGKTPALVENDHRNSLGGKAVSSTSPKAEATAEAKATTNSTRPDSPPPSTNTTAGTTTTRSNVGKYKLVRTIGKGNFAKVKLAIHMATGTEVIFRLFLFLRWR